MRELFFRVEDIVPERSRPGLDGRIRVKGYVERGVR